MNKHDSEIPRYRKKLLTIAVAAAVCGGFVGAELNATALANQAPPAAVQAVPAQPTDGRGLPRSFADLVQKVKPAVVNILISGTIKTAGPQVQQFHFPPNSPFNQFFKHFLEQMPGGPNGAKREMHALGSGFIIDPAGYVVTNNHVVEDADKIKVILGDGTELDAKLVGHDKKTDLALLKVKYDKPLPYVQFGNSDKARVGDWVIAIGNPFGLGGTTTSGIISARGRDINDGSNAGSLDDFIQIDAPINRGNSGGPLFNEKGKVIGINTAIFSPNGGNIGIGFAIPSNQAEHVIAQLKTTGHVQRGWLGVYIQEVTPEIADSLGLDHPKGALVTKVMPDSPAAKAGLKAGDVILSYNGKQIDHLKALPNLVADTPVDQSVDIGVWRDGKSQSFKTEIVASNDAKQQVAEADSGQAAASPSKLGMELARITPDIRQRYGLDKNASGVVIVDVGQDSPAAEQGLQSGDVIVKVGSEKVTTPSEVARQVAKAKSHNGKAVLMLIDRDGNERFIALRFA